MKPFSKLALSCILYMHTVSAVTTTWTDATGNWNTAGNWSAGVPTAADIARINNSGTAQLTSAPAGVASTVNLGAGVPNVGNLLVDNQPLTLSGAFVVGTGSVTIQNGGAVTATVFQLGSNPTGAGGTLLLDGVGSTLTTTVSDLFVGTLSSSTATIQNGGVATTAAGIIADFATSSPSTVNVKNSGSLWNVTGVNFQVGANGNGFLNISDSGHVQSLDSSISINGTSVSTTTVTDANSLWAVTGPLAVGQAGTGTLTISNSGQVTTTGITTLAVSGFGNLNLNSAGIFTIPQLAVGTGAPLANFNGGILQANASNAAFITGFTGTQLNIQAGGLTIDSQSFNIGTNNPLSGVGSLTKTGTGILTLSGTNTYGGDTTVTGGTLQPTTTASLPTNTNVTLSASGTTLDISTAVISPTIGDLSGVVGSSILLGGSSLTFGTSNSTTVASAISGSGSLTKQGSGIVTFSGSNTYSGGTTVNAGTLKINTTSSLPSGGNVNTSGATAVLDLSPAVGSFTIGDLSGVSGSQITLGSSNLTVGTSNSTTFAGSFTGTGTLTKTGTGTLSLPNSSAGYTGSVLLNNGALSIGNANSLGTANDLTFQINSGNTLRATGSFAIPQTINLSTNGNIDTQANTLTISGGIAGTGSLTKIGTGTLSLPTANGGYTGSTFLSNGTLSIGNATSLGSGSLTFQTNPGNTLQAGASTAISNALFLNTNGNIDSNGNFLTLNGPVTGAGSLTKVGAGTVELSSLANNYGGTFINSGILQVTGSIVGPVTVNAGTFDVENSFTITDWTGAPGSFAILGIGTTLTFGTANSTTFAGVISDAGNLVKQGSGTVTFTGASTYTGTTLINAGTLVINGSITSPTTVAAGATLKGTGTIASSLTVNGTLRPGNSVGTLNVAGPVVFNSGSTYVVELNPTQASLLNVTSGSATINPGVTLSILPIVGTYTQGSIYTIIQTTTGVSGTFSTVTNSFPLLTFKELYNPLNVQLVLEKITPFASLVTGNAKAIAACLDKASPTAGSDLSNVLNQLRFVTSTETLQHDFNELQPSQFNAFQLTQENVNTRIFSVLDTRMGQIHRSCKPSTETWSIWADGFGDFQEQKHQQGEHGFHAMTGAALFGFDGHASPHLHLGVGGAYTATHLKWGGTHGTGDISSGYGFAYGTWHQRHVFLDAEFVGGYNNYDAKRHIGFLATDRNAKSEHHGYTLAGRLLGGFPFKLWSAEVAPLIAVDYDFVHQTSFKEHGANSLNLRVHEKNANLLRAEAGFRVTRRCPLELKVDPCTGNEICGSDVRFLPSLQLTVIREWRFQGQKTKARLQGVDCTFISRGLNPDRTLISPAVGLTWLLYDDRVGVTVDYVGEFDVDGKYWDQKANLQISYAF